MLSTTKPLVFAFLLAVAAPLYAQQPVTVVGTVPVSASSLPLPTGAATETTLGAIKTDVDKIPAQGQALAGASMPVVLPAAQITTLTPPAAITGFLQDATFTGRMPAGASPANGESNTSTSMSRIGGYNFVYNGSTWDRWTGAVSVTSNPSQAPTPSSASGDAFTECVILSAASTNATNCKNAAGNFISYELYNTSTTIYYLRLYNLSTAPTCSSATGFIRTIPIPPASAAGGMGGIVSNNTIGVQYGTGIAYCLTGGSASTDNTNAATGVFGSLKVK